MTKALKEIQAAREWTHRFFDDDTFESVERTLETALAALEAGVKAETLDEITDIPPEYWIIDAKINEVWGNANFGNESKRHVILQTLLQHAGGFSTGHTAMVICQELGLLGKHRNGVCALTKKGKRVMYFWNEQLPRKTEADTIIQDFIERVG